MNYDTAALIDAPLDTLTFTVFDTESTGTNPQNGDKIIELAGVRILPGFKLDRQNSFHSLINPHTDIPVASTEIHGITRKDVAGAPDAAQVLYDFIDFSRGTVLAAHDAPKDISFLKKEMSDYGTSLHFDIVLDTLRFSRKLYPEQKGHSLDHIIERLNFRPTTKFRRHRALYDAESTANALRFMLKKVFDEKFYLLGELTEFLRKPF